MPAINFVLPALDSSLLCDLSGTLETSFVTVDASSTAVFYLKTSQLKSVFNFQTDAADINDVDATDIKYYVSAASWPAGVNPAHAMMHSVVGGSSDLPNLGSYDNNKNLLKHDFVRYLAYKLFNTVHGVDLFNNEAALLTNIASKGADVKASLLSTLTAVDDVSGVSMAGTDASGKKYLTNSNTTSSNVCRELMRQIAARDPARLNTDISGTIARQSVPLKDNDTINFLLTVSPASGQHLLTGRPSAIESRVYKVSLVLKADADAVNTTVAESDAYVADFPYSS
jgi:hypothetical protein